MNDAGARSLFEKAAAIARAGRPEDGVRLIEEAAEGGDPRANFIVAHWLLYGSTGRAMRLARAVTCNEQPTKAAPKRFGFSLTSPPVARA